jgi:hypothetical protein
MFIIGNLIKVVPYCVYEPEPTICSCVVYLPGSNTLVTEEDMFDSGAKCYFWLNNMMI